MDESFKLMPLLPCDHMSKCDHVFEIIITLLLCNDNVAILNERFFHIQQRIES